MNTKWGRAIYNISILVTWSTQRRNFSSLRWRDDVMIELCMCRTCSIVQIKIVQAAWHSWRWTHSRVLGVTRDKKVWQQILRENVTQPLISCVSCLSSPPSTLGSGCYELNKYLLFLYFRYVGAAMCDSRLASVTTGCEGKCDPTSDLCSLLPLSQPSPRTTQLQPSPMLFVLQTVELETKLHEVWSFTIT